MGILSAWSIVINGKDGRICISDANAPCEIYGSIYRMRKVAGRIPMAKNRQSSEKEKAARGGTMQAGSADERRGDERRTSKLSHTTTAALLTR